MGGDPTLDVVTQVKASIVSASSNSASGTITLNQTQYSVVPESGSKVYIYANTPFDLSSVAGDFYDLQVIAVTAGGTAGQSLPSCSRRRPPTSRDRWRSQPWSWTTCPA